MNKIRVGNGRNFTVKKIILLALSLGMAVAVALPALTASADEPFQLDTVYTPNVTGTQGLGGWYYLTALENSNRFAYMPTFTEGRWWADVNDYQMGAHAASTIHPGLNYDAVLAFELPASGRVTVTIPSGVNVNDSTAAERPGDGVTFGVFYQDDVGMHELLPMTVIGNGQSLFIDPITLDVRAGGLILFRCGNGNNHYMDYDGTYMVPEITYNSVEEGGELPESLLPTAQGERRPITVGSAISKTEASQRITDAVYEIGSDRSGSVISLADVEIVGAEVVINASDVAITDLRINGGRVLVKGERVTLENCAVSAPVSIEGAGFFALNCDFSEITVLGGDTVIARSVIGDISLSGKNQTLYGNEICGKLYITDASNVSIVANRFAADSKTSIGKSMYINLSDNTVDGNAVPTDFWQYDERLNLWGSDLSGVLEGTDYVGADQSRLPQNDTARFAESTLRTKVYYDGQFVSPDLYMMAVGADCEEVIFPAGIYENLPPFSLSVKDNLTVSAYGMYAKFASYTSTAVAVSGGGSTRILGITIDHMLPSNAQGTVIATEAGGKVIWKPDDGYVCDITDTSLYALDGHALVFKAGEDLPYADCNTSARVKNEDGSYTVTVNTTLNVGDRMSFRGVAAHVCSINSAGAVTFADVTVWGGSGFAFSGWMGEDRITLSRCMVVPGPKPDGATMERLHSTCDASHFTNMRVGPVLEDCVFTDMTDDGTNINGNYMISSDYDPETRTFTIAPQISVVTGTYAVTVHGVAVGDRIRLLSPWYGLIGETVAESTADDGRLRVADHFEFDFDNVIIQNLDRQSVGFAIRNCVVERIRSRGLLIKSSDGIIEHCTIRDTRMSGIHVKPESHEWPEFGFAENLIIRNNRIVGTGYAGAYNTLYSPILVSGDGATADEPIYRLHKDILIEGNSIEERCCSTAIYLSHLQNSVVRNNVVSAGNADVLGVDGDMSEPLMIVSSNNVEFSGNIVPDAAEGIVRVRKGCSDIGGTDVAAENDPVPTDPPQTEVTTEATTVPFSTEGISPQPPQPDADRPTDVRPLIGVAAVLIAAAVVTAVLVYRKKKR